MVCQSDRTILVTILCDVSIKLRYTSSLISSQHVSDMLRTHQNGRQPTALLSPNPARNYTPTQNPSAQSHFSHVLASCWNQSWQNVSLRPPYYVVQPTPRKWKRNQRTLLLMHFCKRLRLLPTLSAKRRPPIKHQHGQLSLPTILKEHSTKSTSQHSWRLWTNARCQYFSPNGLRSSILLGKWHSDLISNLKSQSHMSVAYHRDHRCH